MMLADQILTDPRFVLVRALEAHHAIYSGSPNGAGRRLREHSGAQAPGQCGSEGRLGFNELMV